MTAGRMGEAMSSPLRVEEALRLLPQVDALVPLRALFFSLSRPDDRSVWASSGPYLTVGKRHVGAKLLRQHVPQVLGQVTEHVAALYDAVIGALECRERGDLAGAVSALLAAGEREERVGRLVEARGWYEVALSVGEALRDRRPEVEALQRLGGVCARLREHLDGARYYQRSLALAEVELGGRAGVAACRGLGEIALAQGAWAGAEAWFQRGLALADGEDRLSAAQLYHSLSIVAHRRGDLEAAHRQLLSAREILEGLGNEEEMARLLNSLGLLDAQRGRHVEALEFYREALAREGGNQAIQMAIRINLAELYLETGRLRDAEDEIRRAEEIAISHSFTAGLAHVYVVIGKIHRRRRDENGFVFFEKAIELCRSRKCSPLLEGQIYYEYAVFRAQLGEREEARAHLERARDILEPFGDVPELTRVHAELERLSASGEADTQDTRAGGQA